MFFAGVPGQVLCSSILQFILADFFAGMVLKARR